MLIPRCSHVTRTSSGPRTGIAAQQRKAEGAHDPLHGARCPCSCCAKRYDCNNLERKDVNVVRSTHALQRGDFVLVMCKLVCVQAYR